MVPNTLTPWRGRTKFGEGEPHFSNSYASKASVGGEKRQGERVSQGFPKKTHIAACGSSLAPAGKRVGDKGLLPSGMGFKVSEAIPAYGKDPF